MSFKHNCSDIYLLSNKPIIFKDDENDLSFEMKVPTILDLYSTEELNVYIGFLETDIKDLEKSLLIDKSISSHYDFISLIGSFSKLYPDVKNILNIYEKALQFLIEGVTFNRNFFYINEDIIITPTLFNQINEVLFKSLDKEYISITTEDDEWTKREKAARLRAEQIRAKSKKEGSNMLDLIAAILYEFQQYKIEDILNFNIFTFNYLFKYIGKISNYQISQIATGNGLTKKHKYFIEK